MNGIDRLQVAECPMSWCQFTTVVEDPDDDYEAAYRIQEHVNSEHSKKDMETLADSVDTGTDQEGTK